MVLVFVRTNFSWVLTQITKELSFSLFPATEYGSSCAPSVLIYFINMMLFKENPVQTGCNLYMFKTQPFIQKILVFVSLACIPVLLLGKPLYVTLTRKRNQKTKPAQQRKTENHSSVRKQVSFRLHDEDSPADTLTEDDASIAFEDEEDALQKYLRELHEQKTEEQEEPISEVFIHQAIHTIEYVLSTISHTASYLRLWALSLAHARELAKL